MCSGSSTDFWRYSSNGISALTAIRSARASKPGFE